MTHRKFSRLEIIQINKILTEYLEPSNRIVGTWKYKDNFSDEVVAKMIGNDVKSSAIGRVRQELFGHLDTKKSVFTGDVKLIDRIQRLEQTITSIEDYLTRTTDYPGTLRINNPG